MTTVTELATRCATALGDSEYSMWTAASIREWIKEAIRRYSQYLPRVVAATIDCVTGDRQYDLPAGLVAVTAVEYPVGEDPPEYLARMSYQDPRFWVSTGVYDVLFHDDAGDMAELVIGEEPTTGETIAVTYEALHDYDLAAGDALTVPAQHEYMLILYVKYLAYGERAGYWAKYAGTTAEGPYQEKFDQARTFQELSDRALAEFRETVAGARRPAQSQTVAWKMDRWDRVY